MQTCGSENDTAPGLESFFSLIISPVVLLFCTLSTLCRMGDKCGGV